MVKDCESYKIYERDKRKNLHCKNNNINVLRIDDTVPFKDYIEHMKKFILQTTESENHIIIRIGKRYTNLPIY